MRRLARAILILLAGAPGAATADGCDLSSWSDADRASWERARGGASLGVGDGDLDDFVARALGCPARAAELPPAGLLLNGARIDRLVLDHHDVGARFACIDCAIGTLTARGSRWRRGLDLTGATVAGAIDLTEAVVDDDFAADGARVLDRDGVGIRLDRARFARSVAMAGARLAAPLSARSTRIAEDLRAEGLATAALDLAGASIGGALELGGAVAAFQLDLTGAQIGGTAALDRIATDAVIDGVDLVVGGRLRLDEAVAPGIALGHARIGGDLDLSGARIAGAALLDKAAIGGDLVMRAAAAPTAIGAGLAATDVALSLNNATVGGRIDVEGAAFGGGLSLDAIRIAEDLWLRRGSSVAGPIVAVFARIGQNLDLSGSALGDLDATGAKIGGEIRLGRPGAPGSSPDWRPGSRLVLRNVAAAAWVDPADEDCAGADAWPGSIDVAGFAFDRVGGLGGGDETARERCGTYLDWLSRQQPFSLDPYRRLADYLDVAGRAEAARSVRWAAKERQLGAASGLEWARLALQRVFVGYGIYSYLVFGWMAALSVLGALVFRRAPEAATSPAPLGLLFSIDTLLPFVSFRNVHDQIELHSRFRYYLYFHKFMGWVFALFFVSALGGLFAV